MALRIVTLLVVAASVAVGAPKPEAKGRAVLEAQIAAIHDGDAKVRALYDKDAVLLGSESSDTVGETATDYVALIETMGSVQVDGIKIDTIAGSGDDHIAWFTATTKVAYSGAAEGVGTFKNTGTARISQLAVLDGTTWKVVASLVDSGRMTGAKREPARIAGATARGPLVPLLASPKALADALSTDPNVFVIGTEQSERAIGPAAAKKLLGQWSKLNLSVVGDVREVETKSYGFAQANVKWTKGKDAIWMQALIIAVPSGDSWRVVGVHYLGGG